jgi:hypothetical protein
MAQGMCQTLLKTAFVASIGSKLDMALNAQQPAWSMPFLARQLKGNLGLSEEQWLSFIKNVKIDRVKHMPPDRLYCIARTLGIDYDWLSTEDEEPIRWRAYPGNVSQVVDRRADGTAQARTAPYYGYVPAFNFSMPDERSVEKLVTGYDGPEDVIIVKVRGHALRPRFQPGAEITVVKGDAPVPDVFNLALCPSTRHLELGYVTGRAGSLTMNFVNPEYPPIDVSEWEFLGHAVWQFEGSETGLGL